MSIEEKAKDLAAAALLDVINEAGAAWARTPTDLRNIIETALEHMALTQLKKIAGVPMTALEEATAKRAVANVLDVKVGGQIAAGDLLMKSSLRIVETLLTEARNMALRLLGIRL
jgi:hypothetical protein